MKNQVKSASSKAVQFAEITKSLIRKGNIIRAKKCLSIAEQLLINGNSETKNVISNIYIFSVSILWKYTNVVLLTFFHHPYAKNTLVKLMHLECKNDI